MAYSIVRPLMDERTASKMVIYSHGDREWKQALLADVDVDQLPLCYGGTNNTNVLYTHFKNIYLN
jgi:hypothetical protein